MVWGELEDNSEKANKNKNLFKIKSKNEILNEINNKDTKGLGSYKGIVNDKDIENLDENKIDIDEYEDEDKNEIKLVLYDNENNFDEFQLKSDKPIVNQKNQNDDIDDLMDFKDLDFDERKK